MRPPRLPDARGPLTEELLAALRAGTDEFLGVLATAPTATGEDAALALWVLHELHYRGFAEVDDRFEWDPQLIRVRTLLERDLEARLRARFTRPEGLSFVDDVFGWIDDHDGVSLARHVHRDADRDQVLDLLRARSLYHLKESDPASWLVPRLGVRAKAALMELQYDEYGDGDPNRLHHHLFALGMAACGLEPAYDAHYDAVPPEALEQSNALSMVGLQRRLRGAALGHLAAFEATSSVPSRRMAQGLERLGFPDELVGYYTEHVEADAVHEQLAVRTVCGAMLAEEPELEDDLWFGAFTCLDLEDRFARAMLDRWGVSEVAA
ncbi:iron-containing redox enzyme family protein [Nocardioides sp. YIM 152315]|uniref:iron-containing redox enzyme family protein n=1 Tax=Nocardioides sp. YIM 152315 TaxID=3031760 RepID=UPI0023D9DA85|nr:iron-containing redox enzyme family protein [Nocardioides sp. YIM 152315]MDF1606257.1 iron-containing redox enzyme family protein [Nocardioides sp. YIM 152315]